MAHNDKLTPSSEGSRHQVTGGVALSPEKHMTDLVRDCMRKEDREWNSGSDRCGQHLIGIHDDVDSGWREWK